MNSLNLNRVATLGCLCFISLSAAVADIPAFDPAAPPDGFRLVWSDEFKTDPDGVPDPSKWGYEEGFIRNNESQYYTKARKENARIENGQLVIEARKENYVYDESMDHESKPASYTSAALETIGKADWLNGRIEVKAKLPAGRGVWPAIWTLGSDIHQVGWPRCGEIDIMELVGKEPERVHGTIHYFANGKHASQGAQMPVENTDTDFHIYAAEWTPDRIDIFVDGHKYNSFAVSKAENDGQNPFHKPHYLILNLALGGSWGGPIDDSIFPQRMTVDYVRIYQKSPSAP
jgi:beta-glucanase (GH16 family)